ncbi:MAG: sensor histidine kinase [Flavobacteriales bacterium]
MAKPIDQSNRILLFTMGTIVVIAACIGWFNYQQQIDLFKEKELFKLDCIANAVGCKLDAKEHRRLLQEFPDSTAVDSLALDPVYMEYRMILAQTVKMKKLSSQMYTLIYDSTENHFVFGLNSDKQPLWGLSYDSYPKELLELYNTGGVLDMYEDDNGTWLSAVYPLMDMEGNVVAALQVDEKFDIYQTRARDKVLFNVTLSLIIIFIIGTLMFFSVRHLLTRQKRIAQERQEVENLRKELLANISHDLRTPLASIQGYLETILMKDDTLEPERRTQFLNTSLAGTVRLRTLVDELFELSKLEAKETQLHAEPINLIDLIHDVVAVHRGTAQTQRIEVHTHISKDLGLVNRAPSWWTAC